MRRMLAVLVVTLVSGVPATAVVCDLLFCRDASAWVQPACHTHGTAGDGPRLTTGHGCDHLAVIAPFIPSSRAGLPDAAAAMVDAARAFHLTTAYTVAPAEARRGPPGNNRPTYIPPLRI